MDSLPNDQIHTIMRHLNPRNRAALSMTSTRMRQARRNVRAAYGVSTSAYQVIWDIVEEAGPVSLSLEYFARLRATAVKILGTISNSQRRRVAAALIVLNAKVYRRMAKYFPDDMCDGDYGDFVIFRGKSFYKEFMTTEDPVGLVHAAAVGKPGICDLSDELHKLYDLMENFDDYIRDLARLVVADPGLFDGFSRNAMLDKLLRRRRWSERASEFLHELTNIHGGDRRHNDIADALTAAIATGADIDGASLNGDTALHRAAYWGYSGIVDVLIDAGADPNVTDCRGNTALHLAVLSKGRISIPIVETLLRAGAVVDARNLSDKTALHQACADVSGLLLEAGADPNARDKRSRTPLHYAVLHEGAVAVRVVLGGGGDPDAQDVYGNTALHYVADLSDESVELLVQAGADLDLMNNERISVSKLLWERG